MCLCVVISQLVNSFFYSRARKPFAHHHHKRRATVNVEILNRPMRTREEKTRENEKEFEAMFI